MLNKFINYFKDDDYSILISNSKLYINNYEKIVDIGSTKLKFLVKNKNIEVIGNRLLIKKLDKKELFITGEIIRVDISDR